MASATQVSVALDWTPNTNHVGFAVAAAKGWYAEAGLDVALLSPHADGYEATPASRVADGAAQFACCPSESAVSWATWPGGARPKLKVCEGARGKAGDGAPRFKTDTAVATLLQGSQHAIVTLKSSGIDRPKLLDGKTYASYGARYEGRIVQEMIRRDGGAGDYAEVTPPMLEIWDAFVKGKADATWVFMPWEGVMAKRAGIEINAFNPDDYVSYGHSPVLVAHPDFLRDYPDTARAFLAATARGYAHAAAHPAEAAEALLSYVDARVASGAWPPLPAPLDAAMLRDSAAAVAPHLLSKDTGAWGAMDMDRWAKFVRFLDGAGLLTSKVQSRTPGPDTASLDELRAGAAGDRVPPPQVAELATNQFLPA